MQQKYHSCRSLSRIELAALRLVLCADRHIPPAQPQLSQFVLQRLSVHSQDRRRAGHVAAGYLREIVEDVAEPHRHEVPPVSDGGVLHHHFGHALRGAQQRRYGETGR